MKTRSLWLVWLAIIWKTIFAYWTYFVERYLVPPGDDPVFHTARVADFLEGQWSLFHNGYPLGFHAVTALAGWILNADALTAIKLVGPLLLILPIPVLYVIGDRLFKNRLAGAFAGLAWAFLALAPVRSFGDGNYPNLLATGLLVPVVMAGLYLFAIRAHRHTLLAIILPFLVLLVTHHLSVVFILLASLPFILVMTIAKIANRTTRKKTLKFLGVSLIVALLVALLFWPVYWPLVKPYAQALLESGSLSVYLGPFSAPIAITTFFELHNPVFVWLGLASLAFFLVSRTDLRLKIFFISWIGVGILLGTTSALGLPGRFARELAIPFALMAGWFFSILIQSGSYRFLRWAVCAGLLAVLILDRRLSFIRPFALPDPYKPLIRVQHDEEPALARLQTITRPDQLIVSNNSNPYLNYLVDREVWTIGTPELPAFLTAERQRVGALYIGARPPLSSENVYPYFAYFDEIRANMEAVSDKELVLQLPTGTKVYQLTE